MEDKKPWLINAFGIIYLVGGIFSMLGCLGGIASYLFFKLNPDTSIPIVFPSWHPAIMIIMLIMATAGIIGGIGLLRLSKWARSLIIILAVLCMAELIFYSPIPQYVKETVFGVEVEQTVSESDAKAEAKENEYPEFPAFFAKIAQSLYYINLFMYFAFYIGTIYFFIRPKVKEQFKSKN